LAQVAKRALVVKHLGAANRRDKYHATRACLASNRIPVDAPGDDMSNNGEAVVPAQSSASRPPLRKALAQNVLVHGPILRTLLWLAWPNVLALSAGTCVVIAETSYIGRLGVESLAAMALVFPFVILTMTMSGGAMGGGVASSIARALGAGDVDRASTLAAHALVIGVCFGLTFMLFMLIFGPHLLYVLGGRGNVLAQAVG
jgi:Na+-driven multidrug efflux pump